ncbi:hypothetical protein ACFW9O_02275 [Streptomyces sp. NPDC059499]|uniref:hypothetical protein n=1 Tax=Streptomyces sp. NPDC059499 TaxID=3346852 RepID=UPI0036C5E966
MSIRYVRDVRRAGAAALLAATLTLTMAACGGDDGKNAKGEKSSTSSAPTKEKETGSAGGETLPDTSKVLVTVKGDKGIDLIVHVAKRDSGGFLTLTGEFKNTTGGRVVTPVQWSGTEEAVARTGPSLAAMTLVDSQEKKRYYVLRDTDNRPLTTTSYDSGIDAGKSLPFFAQFPAPAQTTTTVDLQFPGFTTASIEIS